MLNRLIYIQIEILRSPVSVPTAALRCGCERFT